MNIKNNEKVFRISLIVLTVCIIFSGFMFIRREIIRNQYNTILDERYQQAGYVEDKAVLLASIGQSQIDSYDFKIVIGVAVGVLSSGIAYISNPKKSNDGVESINIDNVKEKINEQEEEIVKTVSKEGTKIKEYLKMEKGVIRKKNKKRGIMIIVIFLIFCLGIILLKGFKGNKDGVKENTDGINWEDTSEYDIDDGARDAYAGYSDEEKKGEILANLDFSYIKEKEMDLRRDFAAIRIVLNKNYTMEEQVRYCYDTMSDTLDRLERMGINNCTYSFIDESVYDRSELESKIMTFRIDVANFREERLMNESTKGMWRESIYNSMTEKNFREFHEGSKGYEYYNNKNYEKEFEKYIKQFVKVI